MKLINFFIVFALTACITPSCKKDPSLDMAKLHVRINATMNGEPFQVNKVFTGPEGLRMTVEDFRFYLSDISLRSNSLQIGQKQLALINLPEQKNEFQMEIPSGTYNSIRFAVGVPAELNGIGAPDFDPTVYPPGHPLSLQNDMYWTNTTGYVFLRIEGKIDTSVSQDKAPLLPWFYHSGTNALYGYRQINSLQIQAKGGEEVYLDIGLEVNDLFCSQGDTIQMTKDNFTHTTDHFALAFKVIQNLRNSFKQP
ncbi:MAG: hypothetical protein IT240_04315 [Bacteroidia bacterium]|jgi:hypothetical protein|nr:hypothetical protein [Bacteroidia bacterium]MCC6768244.1 hypothetical protein [Bacteroidia bacterium]